jgi:RHS repeat-associated protein
VTLVTSATGAIQAAYSYSAWGVRTQTAGSSSFDSPLGYDGQLQDAASGLIYLRARTYDPATGQFLSVDPMASLTLQPYEYADDSPLGHADLTGLWTFPELEVLFGWAHDLLSETESILDAGAAWVEEHPTEVAGITLGALSLVTGWEALAAPIEIGKITLGATGLGAISVGAGAAGASLDASACLGGSAIACAGLGLNGTGAAFGAGADLLDAGILDGSEALGKALKYGGLGAGVAGWGTDIYGDIRCG